MKCTCIGIAAIILAVGAWLAGCATSRDDGRAAYAGPTAWSPAALAANQFTFDLLRRRIGQNSDGDLICSPLSAWTMLTLASAGATGETQKEMQATLHLPAGDPAFYIQAGGLADDLQNSRDVEFRVGNRLWVQSGLHLTPSFIEVARTDFHGGMAPVDFRRAPSSALGQINAWVSSQTHGKIPDLLHASDISGGTRLVLTNAVYFKGAWEKTFKEEETKPAAFYLGTGGTTQVRMMSQDASFAYAQTQGVQVLRLPYRGGKTSMVILLPERKTPLAQIAVQMNAPSFRSLLTKLRTTSVRLHLPRFIDRERLQLADDLQALGMKRAFHDAQFDGITKDEALYISQVIHQSFVQVTETGTEAAAATAIVLDSKGIHLPDPDAVDFTADHPFLYFIMDEGSGAILFVGAVEHPQ